MWQFSVRFLLWLAMVCSVLASLVIHVSPRYLLAVYLLAAGLDRWLLANKYEWPATMIRQAALYVFCIVAGLVNGIVLGIITCFAISWVVPSLDFWAFMLGGAGIGLATAIVFPQLFQNGWLFPLRVY